MPPTESFSKTNLPPVPDYAPKIEVGKHPCRCSIAGAMHMIPDLQKIIAAKSDVSDELKAVIASEIAAKKSNAAQVDLHVIDHANGDSSIHIHVKQVQLG